MFKLRFELWAAMVSQPVMERSFKTHVENNATLASFRRTLNGWLESRGMPDPPRASVVLASHEAVANAIEHSNATSPVLVTAEQSSDGFVVEIVDNGHWRPARQPDEERGRGLAMIKALVSDVQINSLREGTIIRLFQHT
jgi:anti-sigma regulatory factor (Ser/Thr protein kinase)